MRKILIAVSILVASISFAQSSLEKGKIQLNAGFGTSSWGTPIYIGADYSVSDVITIGAEASYQSYKTFGIKSTILGFQGNANYHINEILKLPKEWDLYAGLNLNYYKWTIGDENDTVSLVDDEPFGIGAQIGARYYFNKNFAINIEGGGGSVNSLGKIGLTYKI
nr:outer membrane beta-barrel protein [uncultured Flavobacterium sp.]